MNKKRIVITAEKKEGLTSTPSSPMIFLTSF